jgi:molybdopterin molybdotransferase
MSKTLTVEEARRRMLAAAAPGAPETIALDHHATGRVLAEPISAVRDQPPFDASAMDGWAIRIGDPGLDGAYRIVGESAAGRGFDGDVASAEAIRIFTGAPVPQGCAVVVQEQAERRGSTVQTSGPPPELRTHVRPRGGDFQAGEALLERGLRLDAWRLALAASAGRGQALVYPRPRVAILATGEELVQPGAKAPTPAQIFESNTTALASLVAGWGGAPVRLLPAHDDEAAIAASVADIEAELIVTVGGASVGDYDLVKPALGRLGLVQAVESIALRPGKPTWFGRLSDGRHVLGLPGNPASGLVAAELFLRPLLNAWQGADAALKLQPARLASPLPQTGPREHWMRAALDVDAEGRLNVTPFPDQDSSLVAVFARADALLRRPAGAGPLPEGALVETLRLDRR